MFKMKPRRAIPALSLFLAALILSVLFPPAARAQSESGYDIITQVNALRAAQGLEAYTVDSGWMAYAQQHSQYQADTQNSTHQHSDGSYAWGIGLNENIAVGSAGFMSPYIAVYQIWQDWVHLEPMIGYTSGQAGAGVALGADGNVYYTLNVRAGAPVAQSTSVPQQTPLRSQVTAPFVPLITNTPNPEGVIIHIVGPGESLWGIAVSYGVTMDAIRGLNGMAASDTTIYEGQRLVIRTGVQALSPTPTGAQPTTPTPPPSPTPTPTRTPTRAPAPSSTPTAVPRAPLTAFWQDNPGGALLTSAVGMFLGAGLTLLILRLTGKRSRNAPGPEIPPEEEHTPGETK
jgi:LysM repeat protein